MLNSFWNWFVIIISVASILGCWWLLHWTKGVSDRSGDDVGSTGHVWDEDLKELTEAIWDLWGEHGKNRERVGEFIQRIGLGNFLDQIGLDPVPEMISHPRTNPYIFFELDEEE